MKSYTLLLFILLFSLNLSLLCQNIQELESKGKQFISSGEIDSGLIYSNKAANLYFNKKNYNSFLGCKLNAFSGYIINGDYKLAEDSLKYLITLASQYENDTIIARCYNNIASIYNAQGYFKLTDKYLKKSSEYFKKLGIKKLELLCELNRLNTYTELSNSIIEKKLFKDIESKKDSIFKYCDSNSIGVYYFQKMLHYDNINNDSANHFGLIAIEYFKRTKNFPLLASTYVDISDYYEFNKKLDFLQKAYDIESKYENDKIVHTTYVISKAYFDNKNFNKAIQYLNESVALGEKNQINNYLVETYELAIIIYLAKRDLKNVEKYYLKLNTLKALLNEEEQLKSISEVHILEETAEKESQIKSQQLTIQKERNNRNLALGAIGFIVFAGGGIWYYLRNKQARKELIAQNELLQLKQNFHTMEIQNLNQQLSPHEVKNMLASISPEIQEKAPESYKRLIKLLNLTMASLKSETFLDSLSNQVSQIDDLLYLEKAMLGDKLTYSIQNNISEDIQIPRLLLKNLVENAIKHGIKTKDTGGQVKIELTKSETEYLFKVEDNGTGRTIKQTKDTGIGTSTYRKLFDILNQKNQSKASFEIIDLPQGTKIEVKIPLNYQY